MSNTIEVLPQSWKSIFIEIKRNDLTISTATGFIIKHNNKIYLITNRHVVTGLNTFTGECLDKHCSIPNKLVIYLNKRPETPGQYGQWVFIEQGLYVDYDCQEIEENRIWIEHPTLGSKIDVIAIELPAEDNQKAKLIDYCPYEIEPDSQVSINPSDYLSVVGFPFGKKSHGFLAIWTTGFLATDINIDYDNLPLFLIDCRARTGQSGSPVLFHRNGGFINNNGNMQITTGITSKLLGVYSGRINKESDLGFVWKLKVILEIIQQ